MAVCVAVPTDDGETVKLGHFGDGAFYLFYEWTGSGWRLRGRVENPYRGEHHHGHGGEEEEEKGKRRRILELISGCDVVVAVAFGPGGREFMERHGKRVVIVKPRTRIVDALRRVEEELGLRAEAPVGA